MSNPKFLKGSGTSSQNKKPYEECSKKNYGDCLIGTDNCFSYGKNGNKVKDLPNLKGQKKCSGQAQTSDSNVDPFFLLW